MILSKRPGPIFTDTGLFLLWFAVEVNIIGNAGGWAGTPCPNHRVFARPHIVDCNFTLGDFLENAFFQDEYIHANRFENYRRHTEIVCPNMNPDEMETLLGNQSSRQSRKGVKHFFLFPYANAYGTAGKNHHGLQICSF